MTTIIAHRGASAEYPENTMLAFEKAVEAGCDGIELDVHLSADGGLAVIHDSTLERTTDGSGNVSDRTLKELSSFDASGKFRGVYGFNSVPSLGEYFEFIRDTSVFTNIELKNSVNAYPGLEEKLVAAVRESGLTDRVLFSSFNHQSLLKIRNLSPGSEIAFIVSSWLVNAGEYCRRSGADFLNPRYSFLTDENLEELGRNGVRIQAWTVDDPAEMRRLSDASVYGIITNDPALAVRTLRTPR